MTTYSDIVKNDTTGAPVANVSVYVYKLDKTLATITPTNPVVTDSYGEFSFNAADGMYRVSYVVGGKIVEKDYIIVGVGPSIPVDVVAALIPFQAATVASQNAAATSAAQAATSVISAAVYAATVQALANGTYASTANALSNGVAGTSGIVGGSGGTNGQFDVAFSGGAGTGAAARFTVAGGALTSIIVTAKGSGYTSAPTMSFAASSGLTGASATAVIGQNVPPGANAFFGVVAAGIASIYLNSAGTAVKQFDLPSASAVTDEDSRALLAALPRGAISIHPFDRLAAGTIPNIIDGTAGLVTGGSVTSGVFTGNGTITFPSSKSMDDWTMSCLVQVTGIATYNTILYDFTGDVDHFSNFSFHSVSGMGFTPGAPINPRTFDLFPVGNGVYQNQFGGFTNLVGKGWHVLTMRQDRTGITYWIDGVKLYQGIGFLYSTLTFTKLRFGLAPDSTTAAHNYAGFLGIWDRGLSDEEIREVVWQQRARVAPNAIIPNERANRVLIAEGDSNHGPHDTNCWIWQYYPNDSPENLGGSYAINGSTVATLASRAAMVDSILPPQLYGRKFILTVGIGTNDLPNYTSTAAVTTNVITPLRAYMMARKAAGWTLALFTIPKRGDSPSNGLANFETNRLFMNADILANPTLYGLTGVGQVIDIGSATGIGSSFDSTKYAADLLHFNATGGAQVETLARPVINAL